MIDVSCFCCVCGLLMGRPMICDRFIRSNGFAWVEDRFMHMVVQVVHEMVKCLECHGGGGFGKDGESGDGVVEIWSTPLLYVK